MNTPKLPPLPEPLGKTLVYNEWGAAVKEDNDCFTEDQMQAYAIATIEAQGVPDGYAGSLYVSGSEHCVTVEFESAAQAQAYQNWLASAPPAPQADKCPTCNDNGMIGGPSFYAPDEGGVPCPDCSQAEDDSAASVNATNAALAGRYFELLKVVEQYEKSGVTCQTFRHFISEPCAECNSPGICGKQASAVQQELLASAQVVSMNDMQGVIDWLPHQGRPIKVGDYLYTHPAQQAKPQPLIQKTRSE